MARIYTAQEMRHAADLREAWGDKDEVNEMLRQAADLIEREERRDKKYQYEIIYTCRAPVIVDSLDVAISYAKEKGACCLNRREVGKWEEVTK